MTRRIFLMLLAFAVPGLAQMNPRRKWLTERTDNIKERILTIDGYAVIDGEGRAIIETK